MREQFQIQKHHSILNPWRLGWMPILCWVVALANVAIHPTSDKWWQWPRAWRAVFMDSALFLMILLTTLFFALLDHVLSVDVTAAEIVVHREIEKLPIIGRWFRPRRFARPEWRMATTRRGLLIGKPSDDMEFQWEKTRVFLCSNRAKPALKAWLAQLD